MKYFKTIYVEITNVCNLNCSFCLATNRAPEYMKQEEFMNILKKLQGHTRYLYFHVLGEPLLHPQLEEFIALSHQQGYQVQITTNGTLLTEPIIRQLLQKGLRQINISLHSWKDNYQNGPTQEFEQYLKQIIQFIEKAHHVLPELYINLRLWNLNDTQQTKEGNQYILQKIPEMLNLPFQLSSAELIAGQSITLSKNLFLQSDLEFIWPSLKEKLVGHQGYCYGLKNQIAILADSTVVPCCLDGSGVIALGNLRQNSLAEILQTPRALAIINGFAQRKVIEPLCQRCNFRTRFTR